MIKWSKLKKVFKKDFWRYNAIYLKGIFNLAYKKYAFAIYDFEKVLHSKKLPELDSLIYIHLGIAYARLNNIDKSEECLIKALEYEENKNNGELFQWLGYIHYARARYEDAIECFRKAFNSGQKGIDKWLINQKYVKDNIIQLNKIIRENRDIFPDFGNKE